MGKLCYKKFLIIVLLCQRVKICQGKACTILYLKTKSLATVKFGKSKVKCESKDVFISGEEMHILLLGITALKGTIGKSDIIRACTCPT